MFVPVTALALLATAPDGSRRVQLGDDERAYRRAFGSFVESWGVEACWYDDDAKELGCDAGLTLGRWRARVLGRAAGQALVVLVEGRPVGIYLVDDTAMAARAMAALAGDGVSFELVATEPLPEVDPKRDEAPLTASIRTRQGSARPAAPRPALSPDFCPRCQDYPLHVEPLFDAHDADGARYCLPCAKLEAVRASADPG